MAWKKSRGSRQSHPLRLELLEERSLLSGFRPLGAAFLNAFDLQASGQAAYLGHSTAGEIGGGHCGQETGNAEKQTVLTTNLTDPTGTSTATGTATFKSGQDYGTPVTELKVSISGATPASILDVAV